MKFLLVFSISLVGLLFLIVNVFLFFSNKKVRKKIAKVFLVYLLSLALVEALCHAIGFLSPNSNLFLSHIYFGFQFVFVSILYYKLIDNYLIKNAIVAVGVVQILYLTYTYLTHTELFWGFNTYEIVSSSAFLILYTVIYVFKNLELQHKYFNFSVGLFFYLMTSITIFLSGQLELVLLEDPYIDIWVFNSLFYILFQYFIYREYLFFKKMENDRLIVT